MILQESILDNVLFRFRLHYVIVAILIEITHQKNLRLQYFYIIGMSPGWIFEEITNRRHKNTVANVKYQSQSP